MQEIKNQIIKNVRLAELELRAYLQFKAGQITKRRFAEIYASLYSGNYQTFGEAFVEGVAMCDNTLPDNSSGSTRTRISDYDNVLYTLLENYFNEHECTGEQMAEIENFADDTYRGSIISK